MPNIYHPGEKIPELEAAIDGGVSMVMHTPDEVEAAKRVCAITTGSNAPLHAIYGMLNVSANAVEQLAMITAAVSDDAVSRLHWEKIETDVPAHDGQALAATLSFAHDLWKRQPSPSDLNVVLAVARPDSTDGGQLEIGKGKPALVFHRGSILAALASAPLRVAKFAVMMVPTGAVVPTQRAKNIVQNFRKKALLNPSVEPLERFATMNQGALQGKKAVIIFLHGLLSIDVGLFDPLLLRLREDLGNDCVFVGFPHNTLATIKANADELLSEINRVIRVNGPKIAFVCHSRGGLVARNAAAQLFEMDRAWIQKIRGCVTFGTPHRGCPLAEAPDAFLGAFMAIQAALGGGSFMSLADGIIYASSVKPLAGITDLRPTEANDSYLLKLQELEHRTAPAGALRALEILGVGGRASEQRGWLAVLARKLLADDENDLVVETESSMSRLVIAEENQCQTECDHFNYFKPAEMELAHIGKVVGFLAKSLGYEVPTRKAALAGGGR
jgi:pimeloyl-ACP methyl ester carboxylesterase